MSDLPAEPLSAELTERYLRSRGIRHFRGQHDGECFFVSNAGGRRLHVHLGISRWRSEVFTIRVAPASFFPAADGAHLARLADAWNQQRSEVIAIVHGSSDPQRIGVFARSSRRIRDRIPFEEFARYVDRAVAAAIDFFAELTPADGSATTAQPLVRDVG
jgi:hypothetical protein